MICETQLVSCKHKINTYLLVLFMGGTLSSLAQIFENIVQIQAEDVRHLSQLRQHSVRAGHLQGLRLCGVPSVRHPGV